MKSLAELEAIRQKTLENIAMRKEVHDSARVVVGMATCGIAAGALFAVFAVRRAAQSRPKPPNSRSVTASASLIN